MERLRLFGILIAIACVLLLAAGCGGGVKTSTLHSPYYGSLDGVATEPADGEVDIGTDSWIHVFWPDPGYPPPHEFSVRLEKEAGGGSWGAVHILYRRDYSDPAGGSWWFEPSNYFSTLTWYRIVIRDTYTGDTAYAYFLTTDIVTLSSKETVQPFAKALKRYRPAGAENAPLSGQPGAVEHKITVDR